MRHKPEGGAVLSGGLDQAGLHGALIRIRDPGVKLVYVTALEQWDQADVSGTAYSRAAIARVALASVLAGPVKSNDNATEAP